MKHKILQSTIWIALLLLLTFIACTKTEWVPYEKEVANRIIEYKVVNASEVLYGIVDDVDNTITVYIPYYLNIDYLVPEIKLDEGAKLVDASGNEIDLKEDLEPVSINNAGYEYTVQDVNNVKRTYTLQAKIEPYVVPLRLGYSMMNDDNGNLIADTSATSEELVNASFSIYGNFESSSTNGKVTLLKNENNEVVPGGLQIVSVNRAQLYHYMTLKISPDIDSGYYRIAVEHQGRKDTLPVIHLTFKRPYFQWLPKTASAGDTITLSVMENNGINTGINRGYAKLIKYHYDFPGAYVPAGFPAELFDVPVELDIISQSRTQIKFKFPELPAGYYSTYISGSASNLNDTGFGLYFDFDSEEWGKDQLLSSAPYSFEITAR